MINIYEEALKNLPSADIDHTSFNSDLYLRVTPASKALVDKYEYKNLVSTFIDNIDHVLWYEIPFAYYKKEV